MKIMNDEIENIIRSSGTSKRIGMVGFEACKNPKIHGRGNDRKFPIDRKILLNELLAMPDGARVCIYWLTADWICGHSIVCEKIDGQLLFVDPTKGEIGTHVLAEANPIYGYYWYRMDNLEINEDFELDEIVRPSGGGDQ